MKEGSPYPKPTTLSDPYCDWAGCEERIQAILGKDDADLTFEDYSAIFYANLPAADYEEGCYYVFPFLNFLSGATGVEERAYEGFFWYVHHFADRFRNDGLIEPIFDRLWNSFTQLTSTFRIVRLSAEELEKFGIDQTFREVALGFRTVPDILDGMTKWSIFDPLLSRLEEYFSVPRGLEQSHWYHELAFHTREWLWLSEDPLDRHQRVFDFFHRLDRFRMHHDQIMRSPISEGFYQYNRRVSPS